MTSSELAAFVAALQAQCEKMGKLVISRETLDKIVEAYCAQYRPPEQPGKVGLTPEERARRQAEDRKKANLRVLRDYRLGPKK